MPALRGSLWTSVMFPVNIMTMGTRLWNKTCALPLVRVGPSGHFGLVVMLPPCGI